MTSIPRSPPPGTVLLGKYRVEAVIGEGGMGVVVRAQHLDLDEPVAIKILLPELLERGDIVQRFLREARAAVKLKGPHVARVLDVGRFESTLPYIVMEHLQGTDLNTVVKSMGAQPAPLAVDLMMQACDAIAEAHSIGIIHRDIKASNFFVLEGEPPVLKVLDFGIATAPEGTSDLTSTQAVMGTPSYMAPEQMRSTRSADARSDIWSLGVVLYELLEGERPFRSEVYSELCLKVAMDPPVPMMRPVPPGLQAVVAKCLTKPIDERFQSVAELAAALVPFAGDHARARAITERCVQFASRRASSMAIPPARASTAMIPGPMTPSYAPPEYTPPPPTPVPAAPISTSQPYLDAQAQAPTIVPQGPMVLGRPTPMAMPAQRTPTSHASMGEVGRAPTVAPVVPAKRGRGGLIASAAVAVLVFGGVGIYAAKGGGSSSASQPPKADPAPVEMKSTPAPAKAEPPPAAPAKVEAPPPAAPAKVEAPPPAPPAKVEPPPAPPAKAEPPPKADPKAEPPVADPKPTGKKKPAKPTDDKPAKPPTPEPKKPPGGDMFDRR